jgi:hypothetical protein
MSRCWTDCQITACLVLSLPPLAGAIECRLCSKDQSQVSDWEASSSPLSTVKDSGFGVWCLVFVWCGCVWCLVSDDWCLVFGVWCLVFEVEGLEKRIYGCLQFAMHRASYQQLLARPERKWKQKPIENKKSNQTSGKMTWQGMGSHGIGQDERRGDPRRNAE